MAEREKDPCRIQLKNVRLSYPHIFKAQAYAGGDGEPAFSASLLIDKGTKLGEKQICMVEDAMDEAHERKWLGKKVKVSKDKPFFKDGDDEEYEAPETEGMMIVSARSYKKPRVLDRDKMDVREGDDGAPYAGCFVDAIVQVWAQDNKFGKRINCSLEAVRFRDDGDPFGAPPVDPDEFDDLDDDDGGRSSRSSRRSRDDDDDKPSRSRRSRDEDEDADEGESRSSRRGRKSRDEDDEDEKPSRRSRRSRDDEDDEDDREASSRRRTRDADEDDDEDRPSRNSRSKRSRGDDDEGGRSGRRSSRRNDDI